MRSFADEIPQVTTATRSCPLHDVPDLALLGAVQKRSVPSNRVPVRHGDIEDSGNAVQRSLPGLFVGEITFDQFDAKLPERLGTLGIANESASCSIGGGQLPENLATGNACACDKNAFRRIRHRCCPYLTTGNPFPSVR